MSRLYRSPLFEHIREYILDATTSETVFLLELQYKRAISDLPFPSIKSARIKKPPGVEGVSHDSPAALQARTGAAWPDTLPPDTACGVSVQNAHPRGSGQKHQ